MSIIRKIIVPLVQVRIRFRVSKYKLPLLGVTFGIYLIFKIGGTLTDHPFERALSQELPGFIDCTGCSQLGLVRPIGKLLQLIYCMNNFENLFKITFTIAIKPAR